MLGTFRDYAWREKVYGKIIFTRVQQRRLISLIYWVKDKTHLEEEASFPDGTIRQELIYELEESITRKKCRKQQNKVEESLITTRSQVQIKASGQWDCWVLDLEINLKMISGVQGIPLSYVIRENNASDKTEHTWEEKAVLEAPLTGRLYKQYNFIVHNSILRNIADASDEFTYVKLYIKKDDDRNDIKSLCSRYENVAMQEHYVSEANCTIETIQYRKERAKKFEKFVSKLIKSVDEL